MEKPPSCYKPHKPHDCRRAKFHNYKAPGTYMISISKDAGCPDFSHLAGGGSAIFPWMLFEDEGYSRLVHHVNTHSYRGELGDLPIPGSCR